MVAVIPFLGPSSQFFLFPAGLYALAALIPLIILYLIRPKPKKKVVPALMFLMKEKEKTLPRSLFRTFIKDWIFLLQLFILAMLAFAAARPFLPVADEFFIDDTVLVIDGSASMQSRIISTTRFHEAIEIAKEELGKENTIILATNIPQIVVEGVSGGEAQRALRQLHPFDTTTNLYESILAAADYLGDKGRVVVISDLIETESGPSYLTAVEMIKSQGLEVVLKNVLEGKIGSRNVGIIDLDIKEDEFTMLVKNYNDDPVTVGVRVNEKPDVETYLNISPGSIESFTMSTPPAITMVEIEPGDDLAVDNKVWISAPEKTTLDILHITNSPNEFLTAALSVMDHVRLTTAVPPKSFEVDHDIIIIDDVDKGLLLPGTVSTIKKKVRQGAALVIMAQEELFNMDLDDVLPVVYEGKGDDAIIIAAEELTFTRDVNFGASQNYFLTTLKEGAQPLVQTTDGDPIVVFNKEGDGGIIYYGMFDEESDFKIDMYYPIFWKRLFDFLINKPDIEKLNKQTGSILNLGKSQKIETPVGKYTDSSIIMNKAGLYETEELTYTSNLLSEKESDTNADSDEEASLPVEREVVEEETPFDLTQHFLIAILVLLFLELLWIKLRGDL